MTGGEDDWIDDLADEGRSVSGGGEDGDGDGGRRLNVVSFPSRFQLGDHAEIGRRLVMELEQQGTTIHTEGDFYRYAAKRGIWDRLPLDELSKIVQSYSGQMVIGGKSPRPLRVDAGTVSGSIRLAGDRAERDEFFAEAERGICFADGFYSVSGRGVHVHPHEESWRCRFAYAFPYTEDEPERFLGFLGECFACDEPEDAEEKTRLLREFMGMAILGRGTEYQTALILSGTGSNGKGVLFHVFAECMPPGSVCNVTPQKMSDDYHRELLRGKLLNMVSELPEADIMESEAFKAIVAGDKITARKIRHDPVAFIPLAAHIYAANKLPGTVDQTEGFWRRMAPIEFGRRFDVDQQDTQLANKLKLEVPRIVCWALRGAVGAIARGQFKRPRSTEALREHWRRSSDQVLSFVEERCSPPDITDEHGEPAGRVYAAYKTWATDNGHRPMASNKFADRMKAIGYEKRRRAQGNRYLLRLVYGEE